MTKPEKKLQTGPLVSPRSFCWNQKCADYGRVGAGNLRKFGFTRKGRQRWQCTTCEGTFCETHGTVFHGKKHDEQTILECLAMVADRNSLAAIHRIKGVKEETVTAWLEQAATHSEALEAVLLGNHQSSRAQLDALWTFVGHKGEKGGSRRSPSAVPSGAARRSKARRGSASDAPSPRPKKKSRET